MSHGHAAHLDEIIWHKKETSKHLKILAFSSFPLKLLYYPSNSNIDLIITLTVVISLTEASHQLFLQS